MKDEFISIRLNYLLWVLLLHKPNLIIPIDKPAWWSQWKSLNMLFLIKQNTVMFS